MKIFYLTLLLFSCGAAAGAVTPAIAPDAALEARVDEILKGMSLEDKIGQMCELTVDYITAQDRSNGYQMNRDAANEAFQTFKVGSILNVPLGEAQTPQVWQIGRAHV